jgi:hypothetical protein
MRRLAIFLALVSVAAAQSLSEMRMTPAEFKNFRSTTTKWAVRASQKSTPS